MAHVREFLTVGGTTPTVSGITQTTRAYTVPVVKAKTTDLMFENGIFGVSVTSFSQTGVPSWAVEVRSNVGGFEYAIAGVTGIRGVSAMLIPIFSPNGTTRTDFIGIPCPTSIDVVGSSTTVGATFGCVVTLNLHNA